MWLPEQAIMVTSFLQIQIWTVHVKRKESYGNHLLLFSSCALIHLNRVMFTGVDGLEEVTGQTTTYNEASSNFEVKPWRHTTLWMAPYHHECAVQLTNSTAFTTSSLNPRPFPPPVFDHLQYTASNQNMDGGKAWERGYTSYVRLLKSTL